MSIKAFPFARTKEGREFIDLLRQGLHDKALYLPPPQERPAPTEPLPKFLLEAEEDRPLA